MIAALFLATAAVSGPPFVVRGSYLEMAKEYCRAEWPDDFSMQNHCLRQQVEGMQTFRRVFQDHGGVIEKALEKCVEDWTKYPRTSRALPDWNMIGYCALSQSEALISQGP